MLKVIPGLPDALMMMDHTALLIPLGGDDYLKLTPTIHAWTPVEVLGALRKGPECLPFCSMPAGKESPSLLLPSLYLFPACGC